MASDPLLDSNCVLLDGACKCRKGHIYEDCKYSSLYDKGCIYPNCECKIPSWAMSQENRRNLCEKVKK